MINKGHTNVGRPYKPVGRTISDKSAIIFNDDDIEVIVQGKSEKLSVNKVKALRGLLAIWIERKRQREYWREKHGSKPVH